MDRGPDLRRKSQTNLIGKYCFSKVAFYQLSQLFQLLQFSQLLLSFTPLNCLSLLLLHQLLPSSLLSISSQLFPSVAPLSIGSFFNPLNYFSLSLLSVVSLFHFSVIPIWQLVSLKHQVIHSSTSEFTRTMDLSLPVRHDSLTASSATNTALL